MADIQRGKISTIEGPEDENGYSTRARVIPERADDVVTKPLVIVEQLRGSDKLTKGAEVVFAIFPDQTGIILCFADGSTSACGPLIVTGSPECTSIIMGGTTNFAYYNAPPLSVTAEEIYKSFNAGRDVYIRLSKDSYGMYLGSSKVLPDIQYIEARVIKVANETILGGYYIYAQGEGFIQNSSTYFYRVVVEQGQGKNFSQISAYLYKPATT